MLTTRQAINIADRIEFEVIVFGDDAELDMGAVVEDIPMHYFIDKIESAHKGWFKHAKIRHDRH